MPGDAERVQRVSAALSENQLDAVVCALPINVLLLTGYWPVVGKSVAIATSEPRIVLVVPEDEFDLASAGGADEIRKFRAGSLDELRSVSDAIRAVLREVIEALGLTKADIGYEHGGISQPATYAAMHLYGARLLDLLKNICDAGKLVPMDDALTRLRSVKTPNEISKIRTACAIAARAFLEGARELRAGLSETTTANLFRKGLSLTRETDQVERADGFAYCMSGPNAAKAYAAYQRSRSRHLQTGDLALVHCNSYADGYWTDITRTFVLGEPDEAQEMYRAIFAARDAAFDTIRAGTRACDVDAAARAVLESRGFGRAFKHGLGHSVGFEAIDHNAAPRLHPKSYDTLETGMVFNIEPAIYTEESGLRHCDMVALTEDGVELLTPFQCGLSDLIISRLG